MRCRVRTTTLGAAAALLLAAGTVGAAEQNPQPSTAAPPATAAPAEASASEGANTVRLRDLEQRVNALKEEVFRSKARLNLLKESVLHGAIAGSRAVILQRNEMGAMFRPVRYVYALDGQEIYSKSDVSGQLGKEKEIEVFNGQITPGNHTLSVQMVYEGNGYGVFSYLKGYKFITKSSRTFTAPEGKAIQVRVVGYEKGNPITTDPKDRPAVDFRESYLTEQQFTPQAAAPVAQPATKPANK